jgi:heavy metal translocating P-type ATPase
MPLPIVLITGVALVSVSARLFLKRPPKRRGLLQALGKRDHRIATDLVPRVRMSDIEKRASRHQYAALAATVIFALYPLAPWLAIFGVPLLSYAVYQHTRGKLLWYRRHHRLGLLIFEGVATLATLLLGSLFLLSVLMLVVGTSQRIIARTEREANSDFSSIFGELSNTAWLLREGVEIEVPLDSLRIADVIVVQSGQMIPVDGQVVSGGGAIDQHLLTGESQPVEKVVGDTVLASTLVVSGTFQIQVDRRGDQTLTGQIAKALENAAQLKTSMQSRGERIVERGATYTMFVTALALPVLGWNQAFALMYSGFGYQMRLAAPLTVMNYLRIAARRGILIKDGRALDTLAKVDMIVLDKTGTLTETVPEVARIRLCNGISREHLLQIAASAEQRQEHPVARAICQLAERESIPLLRLLHSDLSVGHGLCAELCDPTAPSIRQRVLIGSQRFITQAQVTVPDEIEMMESEASASGRSLIYVTREDKSLLGVIELQQALRPRVEDAIAQLRELGMRIYIISGDRSAPTKALADSLGVDDFFAGILPEQKAEILDQLEEGGHKALFIGDGINDSVALQHAAVSASLRGAATIAQDTADILLMEPDLTLLPQLIRLAKDLDQRMSYSETLNNAAGVTCVSGVLLFGLGIGGAMVIYASGMVASITNAMIPLWPNRQRRSETPVRPS